MKGLRHEQWKNHIHSAYPGNGLLRLLIFICLGALLNSSTCCAQICLAAGAEVIYAEEWDNAFRAYNFERPWLSDAWEPQDVGYHVEVGYSFLLSDWGQFFLEPSAGYSRWSTYTADDGANREAILHRFSGDLHIRFSPRALFRQYNSGPLGPRFFMEISPEYSFWMPRIFVNDELFAWSEAEPYQPATASFGAEVGVGYHAVLVGRFVLTPRITFGWYPSVELEDFAQAIQGANVLDLNNTSSPVLTGQGSIAIHLLPKEKGWWSRPVRHN